RPLLKTEKRRRIINQDLCLGFFIRRPIKKQIEKFRRVELPAFIHDMRPITAPEEPIGSRLHKFPREREYISVRWRLAREAIAASKLYPAVVASDQAEQRLKRRLLQATLRWADEAHVVNHEVNWQLCKSWFELNEVVWPQ